MSDEMVLFNEAENYASFTKRAQVSASYVAA